MLGWSLISTRKLTAIYKRLAELSLYRLYNHNNISMEVKGKVIQNLGIQSGVSKSGRQWSKASILIETFDQFPKKIALDNLKNAESFNQIPVGSIGVFQIEVSSNEFNGRWYTSVNCWKWEIDEQQAPPAPQSATPTLDSMGVKGYKRQPAQQMQEEEDSDLPF